MIAETKSNRSRKPLGAPFPYFGGKSRIAGEVWRRFGNVSNYVEPFFGSGAVLLGRPQPFDGVETVNDIDGMIVNFWRAVQGDPEKVAHFADWPVFENDLHARHAWLVERKESLQERLEGDPGFYNAKIAGWWCWGLCCWIGGGFCSGEGPWSIVKLDGARRLVKLGTAGRGVTRRLVHLDAGRGVKRSRVQLGDAGRGVNRPRVHLGNAGQGVNGKRNIVAWLVALAERLSRVRVCCGDWRRVCGGKSGNALHALFVSGHGSSRCAVFLDPPYSAEANRDSGIYRCDDLSLAHDVREWAVAHGDDPRLRIALCGYEGEHDMPSTWKKLAWKTKGGMGNVGTNAQSRVNSRRERIWFSPHCL
jgi:site-specific DNA-adenine methylase